MSVFCTFVSYCFNPRGAVVAPRFSADIRIGIGAPTPELCSSAVEVNVRTASAGVKHRSRTLVGFSSKLLRVLRLISNFQYETKVTRAIEGADGQNYLIEILKVAATHGT